MKTVSTHVDDYLKLYPFLSKFLRLGVINYKALARHIEPEISTMVGQKVSVGAIAVSLQRLKKRDQHKIESLIGRLRGVTVVSDLVAYKVPDPAGTHKFLSIALDAESGLDKPFAVAVNSGTSDILFAEKSASDYLIKNHHLSLMPEAGRYSALIVTREILNETETGGLSYPLVVLAENGILVVAVVATFAEEVIIVDDIDADTSAAILRRAMWR